jgi:antitoxin HicB
MSALTFNVVFEDAGDGWVYAHVPELPEVHTQGEDLDEARTMVREAIELVLEDRRERGDPIPSSHRRPAASAGSSASRLLLGLAELSAKGGSRTPQRPTQKHKTPRNAGVLREADEGIRTLDLRHGKA